MPPASGGGLMIQDFGSPIFLIYLVALCKYYLLSILIKLYFKLNIILISKSRLGVVMGGQD